MLTPETDAGTGSRGNAGLGQAAKQVAERASQLFRLELELATLELKGKFAALGKGIAFGVVALVLALFMLGFLLATIAAALATFMPTWLALLVVTLFLLVLVAILGMLALRSVRRGTPPLPQQAIREAKLTSAAIKSDGSR